MFAVQLVTSEPAVTDKRKLIHWFNGIHLFVCVCVVGDIYNHKDVHSLQDQKDSFVLSHCFFFVLVMIHSFFHFQTLYKKIWGILGCRMSLV